MYTVTYTSTDRVDRPDDRLEMLVGAELDFAGRKIKIEPRRSEHSPHCIDCVGTRMSALCHAFACNAHDRQDGKDVIITEAVEDIITPCPIAEKAGTVDCLCCEHCLPPGKRINGRMCGHPSARAGKE